MNYSSLYVHYPYCKKLCNYCDFYKKRFDQREDYKKLQAGLLKNFDDLRELERAHSVVSSQSYDSIYIGGGTPSLWDVDGAIFFKDFLHEKNLKLAPEYEFTLEVDPGTWTGSGLEKWGEVGVNRFSIGVQSFDERFLKLMDRSHDLAEVETTLRHFRNLQVNYSVDLMLGLPFSQCYGRNALDEIDKLMEFGPSHLSIYILKTRKNYPHNEALPDEEFVREEYLKVSEHMRGLGFNHYEVSNYALTHKESRHNLKYWASSPVQAIGPNATGLMKKNDAGAIRYQHRPSGNGPVIEMLTPSQLLLESVYLALRTSAGLEVGRYFDSTQQSEIKELAQSWSVLGYLHAYDGCVLRLTSLGYLMIDSIIDDFFKKRLL